MADEKPPETSLLRSWAIQRRIVWALILREMLTRYGRHNIGFLWLFVEPMIFTVGVTLVWTAFRNIHASDLPIAAFAVTGYSSVLVWRNIPARAVGALEPNLSLMYHRNVKVFDVFISRILLECMGVGVSFLSCRSSLPRSVGFHCPKTPISWWKAG
ncbi:ABC transporter permease [Sphingobium scionense]